MTNIRYEYVLKQIKQFKAENEKHSQHTLLNLSAFCAKENNATGTATSKHFYTKQSDTIQCKVATRADRHVWRQPRNNAQPLPRCLPDLAP